MADGAVAWAEKMAGVLGDAAKRVKRSFDESSGKGASNGAPSSNGVPSGNAAPSGGGTPTGGSAPSGGGTPSGGAPQTATPVDGSPAANTAAPAGGDAAPAAGPKPPAAPAGSGAKAQAEAAKKALEDVNAILTQAKAAEGEVKTFTTDAQASAKQAADARSQAHAAEKSIPAAAPVPTPQGKDPKSQYDSAIKITGNVTKVELDAHEKVETVRAQAGVLTEANAKLEVAHQGSTKAVEKLTTLGENAGIAAEAASSAAKAAADAAAESKKKADQAVKDKSADKDELMKVAKEDAQHAAAAKDAAAKAEATRKQIIASIKSAGTQNQSIEKMKQEVKSSADAIKQKDPALTAKTAPHWEAIAKAEAQEAEYKAKLSEMDAESVLMQRYLELGGDPELKQLLADEDKAFVTATETLRAELQQWQLAKLKDLDDYKNKLEKTIKDGEAALPAQKQFVEREAPLAEKVQADADALGEKLNTEPGKELSHEISQRVERIDQAQHKIEFNEKLIEKTKAAMDELTQQYSFIDDQYEASEKVIADQRTELDNLTEMDAMSLETKVDYLQTRPKPVRDRIQKQLTAERDRVVRLNVLEVASMKVEYKPPTEPLQLDAIDWKPVQDRIAKLQKATLDDLKKNDPKLEEIQAEYEKAGGDAALLDKRMAKWKQDVGEALKSDKERGDEYSVRDEKLRKHLAEAEARMRESESSYTGRTQVLKHNEARYAELDKRFKDANSTDPLSYQEKAEYMLLEKEIERLKVEVKNYEAQSAADKAAKTNAESLVEKERVRHEQVVSAERHYLPQPTAEDIHKMPLKAKHTELTGKSLAA